MKSIIPFLLIALFICCQPKDSNSPTEGTSSLLKAPSEYFPSEKTQVLVVGTFHFDYPGLDAMKSDEEDKIDVLKEPKKSEVTELVEYIKQFKPNKIAIEAFDSWNATEKLRKYASGEFREERDERYQIAMRIANELAIDTLYSIDSRAYSDQIEALDKDHYMALGEGYDYKSDDPYNQMASEWFVAEDKLKSKVHLLDFFKHMNSRESHQYGYGTYLVGDFKLDNYRGADVLSVYWYNRNLRIFRKLQELTEDENDRILMVFGNGHAALLRQFIECSPEFEFVEFDSLE